MADIDWKLRPASVADVEVVAELRDGFAPAYTWVVEVDGAFAGCVALRPDADAHWLEHFYLTPRLQGSGIGTAVLREVLARCDRAGTPVRLNVLRGSPARRLYERHGFTLDTEDPVDVFMVRAPRTITAEAPTVSM
ncbi:GNAT family N-acetyltransferase [Micromonospora sp. NPDC005171]|uniref:GNAT family N-acetyltransferase n=1 Tax=Micromonospora sp. NPDC005171 TaxID=3156866 RepID=UPI0033BBB8DE